MDMTYELFFVALVKCNFHPFQLLTFINELESAYLSCAIYHCNYPNTLSVTPDQFGKDVLRRLKTQGYIFAIPVLTDYETVESMVYDMIKAMKDLYKINLEVIALMN
jgi:hypothetical protein